MEAIEQITQATPDFIKALCQQFKSVDFTDLDFASDILENLHIEDLALNDLKRIIRHTDGILGKKFQASRQHISNFKDKILYNRMRISEVIKRKEKEQFKEWLKNKEQISQ